MEHLHSNVHMWLEAEHIALQRVVQAACNRCTARAHASLRMEAQICNAHTLCSRFRTKDRLGQAGHRFTPRQAYSVACASDLVWQPTAFPCAVAAWRHSSNKAASADAPAQCVCHNL